MLTFFQLKVDPSIFDSGLFSGHIRSDSESIEHLDKTTLPTVWMASYPAFFPAAT